MPLGRYFLYIGSLLLALLFIAGWYLPPPDAGAIRSDVDRYTIRIHSAQKWPKAVVIDTTLPTIVPPPQIAAVAANAPPAPAPATAHPVRDALALASEAETKVAAPVKPAKRHVRRTTIARQPADHFAGSEMPGFRSMWFAGW